jgi:SAM-dependent methyltransferase
MRLRYELTLKGCEPIRDCSAVDLGTGPGHYAIALAKRGARRVLGVDFAEGMIAIARQHAERAGVASHCEFQVGDIFACDFRETFDYAILMGLMDYIGEPRRLVEKVLSITTRRAFVSFPAAGGLLAWQRRLRYRSRCHLYLYREEEIRSLFEGTAAVRVDVVRIARDYFVTAHLPGSERMTPASP